MPAPRSKIIQSIYEVKYVQAIPRAPGGAEGPVPRPLITSPLYEGKAQIDAWLRQFAIECGREFLSEENFHVYVTYAARCAPRDPTRASTAPLPARTRAGAGWPWWRDARPPPAPATRPPAAHDSRRPQAALRSDARATGGAAGWDAGAGGERRARGCGRGCGPG